MKFETLGLRPELIEGLNKQGIKEVIGIQDKMFTGILTGDNIIACSQTGSGKTLGYLLPIFQRQENVKKGLQVVILVSTHELGLQVHRQVELLAANSDIFMRSVAVFGNANINSQIKLLKTKPQIVIGTPGRVLDLMEKKHIPAHLAQTIIVDEGDFLFNPKNIETVSAVIKKAMRDTQLVVVSASISDDTRAVVEEMGKQPTMIQETEKLSIPSSITHIRVECEEREKPECLRKLMAAIGPTKAIGIVNNKNLLEEVAAKMKYHKVSTDYIHGESTQQDRKNIMDAFRRGKLQLLLATDLVARGMDFDDIDVVFCVTASENPNDYLHKAGRTGRGKKEGMCVSLVSPRETSLYQAYEREFGIKIQKKYLREGKLIDQK